MNQNHWLRCFSLTFSKCKNGKIKCVRFFFIDFLDELGNFKQKKNFDFYTLQNVRVRQRSLCLTTKYAILLRIFISFI